MIKPLEKFQSLLRELFQFDCADLDFGIYRIMNHKRDVIERFITNDLPKAPGRWSRSSKRACSRQWRHKHERENRDP